MHISEGIITGLPALGYTAASIGFVGYGAYKMNLFVKENPEKKALLGMAGAFIFFLSLIPIPAFTGTCSHPCGTPLAGIILGPWIGTALAGLSLLLQAAFFAHGGFSTWGANVITLGIGGAFFGWAAFKLSQKLGFPLLIAGAIGGLIGDLMTYVVAGFSLSTILAFGPDPQFSMWGYLTAIYVSYAPTQLPIALAEMFLTGFMISYIYKQRPDILETLKVVPKSTVILLFIGAATLLPIAADANEAAAPTASETTGQKVSKAEAEAEETEAGGMPGMDEAVNEKLAEEGGLAPKDPYIDLESLGDVWNAVMMLSGAICGFIIGRGWDKFFGKGKKVTDKENKTPTKSA